MKTHLCCGAPIYNDNPIASPHNPRCHMLIPPVEYEDCVECGIERNDCNVAIGDLCRDCHQELNEARKKAGLK